MSVAFPLGVGLALVLGVLINYFGAAKGEPLYIFVGVLLITVAIILNGFAYKKAQTGQKNLTTKGIFISIAAWGDNVFFLSFCGSFHGSEQFLLCLKLGS